MKQKSVVVVNGCEAVVGCVQWWVKGRVCCWSGSKGGFVVGVGRGVGLLIVDC